MIDPETGYDDEYDEKLQWVIDQVIDAIHSQKFDDDTWMGLYEMMYYDSPDSAYEEYKRECRTP